MLVCPNKNTTEWKDLVATVGEFEAFRDFIESDYNIRDPKVVLEKLIKRGITTTSEKVIESSIQEVKPGVPELFDSNPELANVVYEALGFIANINKLKIQDFKTKIGNSENIQDVVEKLKKYVEEFKDAYFVNSTNEDIQSDIYFIKKEAEDKLKQFQKIDDNIKFELVTTKGLSNKQIDVYKSVIDFISKNPTANPNSENYNPKVIESYLKYEHELTDKELRNIFKGKEKQRLLDFIFSQLSLAQASTEEGISELPENLVEKELSKVTPQQKQQALQLYSQYLDSIFPQNTIVYRGSEKGRTQFNTRGFFTEKLSYAKEYAFDKGFVAKSGEGIVNTFLINTANVKNVGEMNTKSIENETQDSVLKGVDKGRARESGVVYATTSKNLHELGGKQDIEGFKEFVNEPQTIIKESVSNPLVEDFFKINEQEMTITPLDTNNANAVGALTALATQLSEQLVVDGEKFKYQFITEEQAAALLADRNEEWDPSKKAFFVGDTVYLVGTNLNLNDVFHEFSHPFLRSIAKANPQLFEKLYQTLASTPEGQLIIDFVKNNYNVEEGSIYFKEEVLVQALTAIADINRNNLVPSSGFSNFIKNLLYQIKQFIRKVFGSKADAKSPIKISSLNENTTLRELSEMLKGGTKFEIVEDSLTEEDFVAYNKSRDEILTDLMKLKQSDKIALTVLAHDTALKQIETVMRSGNYAEIANLLADEFKRGDLNEIKRNLVKFAKPMEDMLLDKKNAIEYTKAHVEAFMASLLRMDKMLKTIEKHLESLRSDMDNIDNLQKAFYYDYLLSDWKKFVDQLREAADGARIPSDSALESLISSLDGSIRKAKTLTGEFYQEGSKDVLYAQLLPMAEKLAEKYSKIFESLNKPGKVASDKIQNMYYKEYYGMTKAEHERHTTLEDLNRKGTLGTQELKELEGLRLLSMNGAQITKYKIEMALKGTYRDANVWNSFFEGYTFNTDPVIGGFATFVKDAMSDAIANAMDKMNNYAADMSGLLTAAGYNPSNPTGLIDKIGRPELIGRVNPDTKEWEEKPVWTLMSLHKNWKIELDRKRRDIDNAQRNYIEKGTDENKKKLSDAIASRKKLMRDYFYQEYDQKVYLRERLLEDPLGRAAAYEIEKVMDEITKLNRLAINQLEEIKIAEKLDLLWQDYNQLFSEIDLNGNRKTGEALLIAKRLKEYRAADIDPATGKSFRESKLIRGLFENTLAQFEQELIDIEKLVPGSDEFKLRRSEWIRKNTRVVVKPEFYEQIKIWTAAVAEILAKLPDAERKKVTIAQIMSDITDLTSGNRDESGQINGTNFTPDAASFIKGQQEKMIKAQEEFDGINGLTKKESKYLSYLFDIINEGGVLDADEKADMKALLEKKKDGLSFFDKQTLYALFAKLRDFKKKDATSYYTAIFNNHLSKLDTNILQPLLEGRNINSATANLVLEEYIVNNLINQNTPEGQQFKDWFLKNHIQKEVYDKDLGETKKVWERIYIWNINKPVDENYYDKHTFVNSNGESETLPGLPAYKYYKSVVKSQYRTERIIGKTVDNMRNWLPREDVPNSPYINEDYLRLQKEDPAHFAVLEKMKEHHIKNQEGLGYKSRLYLDVPRYRKNNAELLKTRSIKQLSKLAAQGNLPFLSIIMERARDFFRRAKDEYGSQYGWDDTKMLVRADMFSNDVISVPITGLYDLNIDDVSTDLNESINRYMFSAERQKKLIEISPIAKALRQTLNDPKNMLDDTTKLDKWNFLNRGMMTYIKKKGYYVRKSAVNNFIEREFEGKTTAGWSKDIPWMQNLANLVLGRASFAFFALNIPSALKNVFSAKYQSMIESSGGQYVDRMSLLRGEGWGFKTMMQVSSEIYKRGVKPLNMQIADSFDIVSDRAEQKLPESMSRNFTEDVASMTWLYNFRKWTEDEAQMQLGSSMLYKRKIMMAGKEVSYMEAWQLKDNKLALKDGIDIRYANKPTEYLVQEGDTLSSLAKKFNMPEDAIKRLYEEEDLYEGKKIKINNIYFKEMRNQINTVKVKLNGAYGQFDQPEAQRYLAYRMISFLKRYFTPMLINRWGYSSQGGQIRGRMNYGLNDLDTGFYTSSIRSVYRIARTGGEYWHYMTPEERGAWAKWVTEIGGIIAISILLGPLFGWDPEDEERFEKLRQKSGAMPLLGLTEDDPDHPFKVGGWLETQGLMLALGVKAEAQAFVPWPGMGLNQYYGTLTDASSIGFGATLKSYMEMLEFAYYDMTGSSKGTYAKDAGAYRWQQEGGSKFITTLMKTIGFTGGTVEPWRSIKNNPQMNPGGGKKKDEDENQSEKSGEK